MLKKGNSYTLELAAFIPTDEDGEIAVRATQASACPGVGTLGNAQFLHINTSQFLDRPHQTRGAAFLEADCTRPRGVQDLLLGPRRPNGVNGVIHPAICQRLDGLDGVTMRRIDPMCCPKPLRKGQLVVGQVYRDDRVCPHNMGSGDGTQSDTSGTEYRHRFVHPHA
jgi:hypothetical protein